MEPSLTVPQGEPVDLTCKVNAYPPPQITWLKDNAPLRNEPPYEISYKDNEAKLRIPECDAEDEGRYSCRASNAMGQDTTTCQLSVAGESNLLSASHLLFKMQKTPPLTSGLKMGNKKYH